MILYSFFKNSMWIIIILICAPLALSIIKEQYHEFITPRHKIGIVTINKTVTDAQPLIKHFNHFFKDKNIKGIIVEIECQEGATGSAQMVFSQIEHLKKEYPKPIIALVENCCIAQGYLIASVADTIVASGAALIGGIQSPSDYDVTQRDDVYSQLITAIARKRKISMKDHALWADGHIFTGSQACKMHLVDVIGTIAHAENIIKEKTLIEGDIEWVYTAHESYFYNFVNMIKHIFVL